MFKATPDLAGISVLQKCVSLGQHDEWVATHQWFELPGPNYPSTNQDCNAIGKKQPIQQIAKLAYRLPNES